MTRALGWTAGGGLACVGLAALVTRRHGTFGPSVLGMAWPWACLALWVLLVAGVLLATWLSSRCLLAVLVAAVLVVGVAAWAQADTARRLGQVIDKQGWFDEHRADFAETAAFARDDCCDDHYLGDPLPDGLGYLSAHGRVVRSGDAVFFPQWFRMADDAGGYWHSPLGSPEGQDMFGMICTDPTDLGDDWWMCGM